MYKNLQIKILDLDSSKITQQSHNALKIENNNLKI